MRTIMKARLLACLAALNISTIPAMAQNGRPNSQPSQQNTVRKPATTLAGPQNSANNRPQSFQTVGPGNSVNNSPFSNNTFNGRPVMGITGPSNSVNNSPFNSRPVFPQAAGPANSFNNNTARQPLSSAGPANSLNNNTNAGRAGPANSFNNNFNNNSSYVGPANSFNNNFNNNTVTARPSLVGPGNSVNNNPAGPPSFNNRPAVVQMAGPSNSLNNFPGGNVSPRSAGPANGINNNLNNNTLQTRPFQIVAGGNSNQNNPFNNSTNTSRPFTGPVVGAAGPDNSANNSPFNPGNTMVTTDTGPSNSFRNNTFTTVPSSFLTVPNNTNVVNNTAVIDYSRPDGYSGFKSTAPKSAGPANGFSNNVNGVPASYSQFNVRSVQFKNTHDREITLNVHYNTTPGTTVAAWSVAPVAVTLNPGETVVLVDPVSRQKITTDRIRFDAEYRGADGNSTRQQFPERFLTRYVDDKPTNLNMDGQIQYYAYKPGTHELRLK
jgi:hypothetical protein